MTIRLLKMIELCVYSENYQNGKDGNEKAKKYKRNSSENITTIGHKYETLNATSNKCRSMKMVAVVRVIFYIKCRLNTMLLQ